MPVEIKPDATSTPNYTVKVKGRRGIRESSFESPIISEQSQHSYSTKPVFQSESRERSTYSDDEHSHKRNNRQSSRNRSRSHDDLSYSDGDYIANSNDSESDAEEIQPEVTADGSSWFLNTFLFILALAIGVGAVLYFIDSGDPNFNNSGKSFDEKLNDLHNTFKSQEEDFWITIKVSIKEISLLNQPRTVLLVYKKNAQKTVERIVNDISKVAVCEITDCSKKPVVITGSSLNKTDLIEDYGRVISAHRDKLTKNGVMIVHNLEKVPGSVAQAFHSFCDDYNPVVKNALILFTLNMDEFSNTSKMRNVEQFLLKLWNDIPVDDKFYPLFTRISSTILMVKPET